MAEQSGNSTLGLRSEPNPKSKIQNLRFAVMAGAMLFALCSPAEAGQAKIYRVGVILQGGV
jgi:hypothetical protein